MTGWNTPYNTETAHLFHQDRERSLCGQVWSWGPRTPDAGRNACADCAEVAG
jgi:hypothetical protein